MSVLKNDNARLFCAIEKVDKDRERNGIGTLGEKTLHAVLKHYYEPDESFHEQKIGRYFADIATPSGIIEIQTAGFDRLIKKLEAFLRVGEVTVVYPVPAFKHIVWIDEETGALSKPNKSPKKGSIYEILPELYKIRELLDRPGLHFKILLLDVTEYRLLNGWDREKKRGSSRFERIPNSVCLEYSIDGLSDYREFVPQGLPISFSAKEFQKAVKLSGMRGWAALSALESAGAVIKTGKKGNAFIFERGTYI